MNIVNNEGLILPTIGTKYYFKFSEKIKPYLDLSILKSVLLKKQNNNLKKPTIWSSGLGFGAEYFIIPQFSLGAEFGGNILIVKNSQPNNYSGFNGGFSGGLSGMPSNYNAKLTNIVSYGGISLNFYFEKNKF